MKLDGSGMHGIMYMCFAVEGHDCVVIDVGYLECHQHVNVHIT